MTTAVIPDQEQLSFYLEYELTQRGGHVGFLQGKYPWWPKFYIEQRIAQFLIRYYSDENIYMDCFIVSINNM